MDSHRSFRRGEARHGEVAGDRTRFGHQRFEFDAFGSRARVVPENRWTQHLARAIEQRRAMHLAGQADAAQRREARRIRRPHLRDGIERGMPPRLRALFGPVRMEFFDFKPCAAGGKRLRFVVGEQYLDLGCPKVDSKESQECRPGCGGRRVLPRQDVRPRSCVR
ncbi:hypothetical protein ABIE53_004406 [Burkholderia sp. OAS925]